MGGVKNYALIRGFVVVMGLVVVGRMGGGMGMEKGGDNIRVCRHVKNGKGWWVGWMWV